MELSKRFLGRGGDATLSLPRRKKKTFFRSPAEPQTKKKPAAADGERSAALRKFMDGRRRAAAAERERAAAEEAARREAIKTGLLRLEAGRRKKKVTPGKCALRKAEEQALNFQAPASAARPPWPRKPTPQQPVMSGSNESPRRVALQGRPELEKKHWWGFLTLPFFRFGMRYGSLAVAISR